MFFKKNKNKTKISDLLKNYDFLINILRKNELIRINEINEVRTLIQKMDVNEKKLDLINQKIIDLNTKKNIRLDEFSKLKGDINEMFWSKKKKNDKNDHSKIIIEDLLTEITRITNEIEYLNIEINLALDNKNETQWMVLNNKKTTLLKIANLKKQSLDTLLDKSSNLLLAKEFEETKKITDILNKPENLIDLERIVDINNDSKITKQEINKEKEVMEILTSNGHKNTTFDYAYEQHLLNKADVNKSSNNAKNKEVV